MNGTHAVPGKGPPTARIVLIGEQPGDTEERVGEPFVGPAGGLLNKILLDVGLNRLELYVTNAVKHFNFEQRGKARIHKRPQAAHIHACKPWLLAELDAIRPAAIVLMGATAATALLGPQFSLTPGRGVLQVSSLAPVVVATWHPSLALRASGEADRARVVAEIAADLTLVAREVYNLNR